VHVGLLIYGRLDTISGGFIYDRHLVRYLREQGDRVEVISLPWRRYGVSLLDNLNAGLRRRLNTPALISSSKMNWSILPASGSTSASVPDSLPLVAIVHHLRCREPHPAWPTHLYRRVEKRYLASVDGYICCQPDHQRGRGGFSRAGAASGGGVSRPQRPARLHHPAEIMARATAPGPLHILFVGNLIPRKELHTLLTALTNLPRTIGG